jgi:hypothetical protein
VTKKPSEKMKTSRPEPITPGRLSGKKTRRKVWVALAPRPREAASTRPSMSRIAAHIGRMPSGSM